MEIIGLTYFVETDNGSANKALKMSYRFPAAATGRIVVVGEGMIEISGSGDWMRLGYGGDTLNSAIHLARAGLNVAYVTALGECAFSAQLRNAWAAEGVDIELIMTDPSRSPGLYAITLDAGGERSFNYWRGESAARRMFELAETEATVEQAGRADVLLFSLISLAILPPDGRRQLITLAEQVRTAGGVVAFDSNYRPTLWESRDAARLWHDAARHVSNIGLPTLEDEAMLFGTETFAAVIDKWRNSGVTELVVKAGAAGCVISDGTEIAPPVVIDPVDTSGAGDAFNAGYLAARIHGEVPAQAAGVGHRLAGWVIGRPGAVPARDEDAPYP